MIEPGTRLLQRFRRCSPGPWLVGCAFVLAATAPARAGDEPRPAPSIAQAGRYALLLEPGGDLLLVFDAERGRLLQYGVGGSGVPRLLGARDVVADVRKPLDQLGAPAGPSGPARARQIPAEDAPGEDPPGFPRISGLVRVQVGRMPIRDPSGAERHAAWEEWQAKYVTPARFEEVYARLREAMERAGIRFDTWSIDLEPARATLRGTRGEERWEAVVQRRPWHDRGPLTSLMVSLERPVP